jgi:periplasmic divalent cation tolerance protein
MSESEFVFVYSTVPDAETAVRAGEEIVAAGLAACVNIHGPMTSIYPWEGKIENAKEFAVFVKTRRALVQDAIAAMRKNHPYTIPCFLILPIEGGNADYLDWARAQLRLS